MNLDLQCFVTSLRVATKPADTLYILKTGGSFSTASFVVDQIYDCHFPVTFGIQIRDANQMPVTPSWIVFDPKSQAYSIEIKSVDDLGVYTITTTASIPQIDSASSKDKQVSESFELTVQYSDCMVSQLVWPVQPLEINFVLGSETRKVTHSDLSSSNSCDYPLDFALFWDMTNSISAGIDLSTYNFQQLTRFGLPTFVSYSAPVIEVASQEDSQGTYNLYVVASISRDWQIPALQSPVLVVVNITPRLAVISNSPPSFPSPLPSFTVVTGESISFPVPLATALDPEGDSFSTKVTLPVGFITWNTETSSLQVDGEAALKAKASGRYSYKVTLTDSKGAKAVYEATIEFKLQE